MKNICVITSTRAEYGLLKGIIFKLAYYKDIKVNLVVTGTHLVEEQGYTIEEIKSDKLSIAAEIPIMCEVKDGFDMSVVTADALKKFAAFLREEPQDCVLLLGDRYETLGFAYAAVLANVPVAHIHGGEITEGAIDNIVRHAITKMSCLHFASTEEYRKRIIQMGEEPDHVYNVGAPGVENILSLELMSEQEVRDEIKKLFGRDVDQKSPVILATYHPLTTDPTGIRSQAEAFIKALDHFPHVLFIITGANADAGGTIINDMIREYAKARDNIAAVASLGMKRYLSIMKYSALVLGNSSSGIIETPSFGLPTVNIGDRQKGRMRASSVIDCDTDTDSIIKAVNKALDSAFKDECKAVHNPYQKAGTSGVIAELLRDYAINDRFSVRKTFYDIDFKL